MDVELANKFKMIVNKIFMHIKDDTVIYWKLDFDK